ncbi:response regulator [Cyanobacteria bacterium FACHB-DQ100]|uniref:response regulator n=1 Tax=unclassified Leptolyngbya TaxID=2650499 RepID=UPI00168110F3|nr:response regulator [Leptolyngbya sp. FACHB-17]MBD1821084.1 response regulator [Cyanobacteria bacterium FACHB-DQ100]MBD2079428.1 response regulator [Leptolyngbya sp. FACHB-17]
MESLEQINIFVVDDDPDTRDLLRFMLEDEGANVTVATNAKEALSLLEKELPTILVSDVAMPEMDGFQLIGLVRELPQGAELPAIALTAYAREEDRLQAINAGFNDYLTKPIDPVELMRVIQQYCGSD